MPRNVELKAWVDDLEALERRVRELARERGDGGAEVGGAEVGEPEVLYQRDTFYGIHDGRLKIRDFGDGTAEVIFYRRPDAAGPTTSHYRKVEVRDPEALGDLLAEALGVVGEVIKKRRVWVIGRTRIHLDRVERLGDFLELEVILTDEETEADGAAVARELMVELGISEDDLVEAAYLDLHEGPGASRAGGSPDV